MPLPEELLGPWGTLEGLTVRCCGITGRCRARRTQREVLFTFIAPSSLQEGSRPPVVICVTERSAGDRRMYEIDPWPGLELHVDGRRLERLLRGAYDYVPDGFLRLDQPASRALPEWAVGDFAIGTTQQVLRTGAEGTWALMTTEAPTQIGRMVSAQDPSCVRLEGQSRADVARELCVANDGETVRFRATSSQTFLATRRIHIADPPDVPLTGMMRRWPRADR